MWRAHRPSRRHCERISPVTVLRILLIGAIFCVVRPAAAQVTVQVEAGPGADLATSLGIDLSELEAQLADEIGSAFAALNPGAYLKAFGNAHLFSNKGLGVDYASNPTVLSVGAAGNISAGLDDELDDDFAVAPGLNVSLMFGLNAGTIAPKLRNLTLYVNFFRFKSEAFAESLSGTLTNFAVHAQYKLLRPSNSKKQLVLQWGGIDLTSGIEFSRLSVGLGSGSLLRNLPVVGDEVANEVQRATVGMNASGQFDLSSTGVIIPIEASTNLRIAYVITVFGGLGLDFQGGKSSLDMELTGDLAVDDPTNPGQEIDLGTATVTAHEDSSPSVGRMRFFGGLQANLWRAKLFLQANVRPEPIAVGLTLGARLAW